MPPHDVVPTGVIYENDVEVHTDILPSENKKPEERKIEIVWRNVIFIALLHMSAVYGVYLTFTSTDIRTIWNHAILGVCTGWGITAGAHRLWSHRSYKAKLPLKLLLLFFHTVAFQNSMLEWARDHRVHHKYSDTDADPHNASRGFFFSHVGWLLCRKHPYVKEKGKSVDMSDLLADPILVFQDKYYLFLMPVCWLVIPISVPMYFWNETFSNAVFMNFLRYTITLNLTWFINSVAHIWGYRPYDKHINATNSQLTSILALGEGWHNYHHTFPWDYRPSELGNNHLNFTGGFIDLVAKIGWAYDLKTVPEDLIRKRAKRTGDGTYGIWGWGDKDQPKEDFDKAVIISRKSKSNAL